MSLFKRFRNLFIISIHFILIILAYYLSFLLRFDLNIKLYIPFILETLPILIIVKMIIFYYCGLFHSTLTRVSMFDIGQVIKANIISSAGFALGVVFIRHASFFPGFPRSIFIIDWGICLGFIAGLRFVARFFKERADIPGKQKRKKIIIVGSGEAGLLALREFRSNPHLGYEVVGFIDDDSTKKNLRIHGVRILGGRKMIGSMVSKYNIEEIIIAIPSATGERIRDIISYCQFTGVKIKIVPGFHKILSGEVEIKLREVKPEDLLGRETVTIDETEVRSCLKGKRVLVTGAAGSIGSELCRQIAQFFPRQLVLLDYNENDMYFLERELKTLFPKLTCKFIIGDIRDISLLKHTFSKYSPQIVFHAAAFKHVPLMEENPSAVVKNNILATRNLIYASDHYGIDSFVFISTDKAVNPTSVMGASKRIGEMILQAKAKRSRTKFMAVRFGNVLGSKGSVVPLFKKQIEDGGPVTVTHPDVKRYFMSTREAVQLVLQASAFGKGGEIFVLDMGEQIKIVDLARDLIGLSGLKPDKDIAIEFVGLRPGEKLSEEVLHTIEKDKATKHDRIHITQPNNFDSRQLRRQIKELEKLVITMNNEKIIRRISEIVPSYIPYSKD
ncbi:MAG: polysaccharide biosynthesis protein [Candidatus Omnitrophica bacterium]|nr:polysaccharide biosynthesis protein [Candidatus Omnitrophota bacterium]